MALSSHRPVEIRRPDSISVAGVAASRAHANPKHVEIWKATSGKPAGKASSPPPSQMSEVSKRWSLGGAIGAVQSSKARRSGSLPKSLSIQLGTEAASVEKSALAAAAVALMPSVRRVPIRRSDLQRES